MERTSIPLKLCFHVYFTCSWLGNVKTRFKGKYHSCGLPYEDMVLVSGIMKVIFPFAPMKTLIPLHNIVALCYRRIRGTPNKISVTSNDLFKWATHKQHYISLINTRDLHQNFMNIATVIVTWRKIIRAESVVEEMDKVSLPSVRSRNQSSWTFSSGKEKKFLQCFCYRFKIEFPSMVQSHKQTWTAQE